MPRIIDCSIAYNETELLDARVGELKDVIDAFVIVESTKTHRYEDKPMYFDGYSDKYARQGVGVIHYVLDDLPKTFKQSNEMFYILEHFQRNSILRPLSDMKLDDDDIVMISDIDEIPRAQHVEILRDMLKDVNIVIFEQVMKKFFVNNASSTCANNVLWRGTVACRYGILKAITPQGARIGDPFRQRSACVEGPEPRSYERIVAGGGWHFSSMGGAAAFDLKHNAIAEGAGGQRFEVPDGRRGCHNHRAERERYAQVYQSFLSAMAPELTELEVTDDAIMQTLDIPDCIKADPISYEHLFYFKGPID